MVITGDKAGGGKLKNYDPVPDIRMSHWTSLALLLLCGAVCDIQYLLIIIVIIYL
jgi:hypothetical protein